LARRRALSFGSNGHVAAKPSLGLVACQPLRASSSVVRVSLGKSCSKLQGSCRCFRSAVLATQFTSFSRNEEIDDAETAKGAAMLPLLLAISTQFGLPCAAQQGSFHRSDVAHLGHFLPLNSEPLHSVAVFFLLHPVRMAFFEEDLQPHHCTGLPRHVTIRHLYRRNSTSSVGNPTQWRKCSDERLAEPNLDQAIEHCADSSALFLTSRRSRLDPGRSRAPRARLLWCSSPGSGEPSPVGADFSADPWHSVQAGRRNPERSSAVHQKVSLGGACATLRRFSSRSNCCWRS
jgi:hypothetical protein